MSKAIYGVIGVGRGGPEEKEDGKDLESSTRFTSNEEECRDG
jgi:hypothetical protein